MMMRVKLFPISFSYRNNRSVEASKTRLTFGDDIHHNNAYQVTLQLHEDSTENRM
jgi:hypothetical protein